MNEQKTMTKISFQYKNDYKKYKKLYIPIAYPKQIMNTSNFMVYSCLGDLSTYALFKNFSALFLFGSV